MPVQPFFARYLESQNTATLNHSNPLENTSSMVTMRYPSDSDNIDPCNSPRLPDFLRCHDHRRCHDPQSPVTMKFPSDNEDGCDHRGHHGNSGGFRDVLDQLEHAIQRLLHALGFGSGHC